MSITSGFAVGLSSERFGMGGNDDADSLVATLANNLKQKHSRR
jgi:hypothetical protein